MSRLKKLENHYQEQLTEKNIKDISRFIQSIIDVDITKGKYARFLIESFLNNQFLEEDLIGGFDSTVGQAISLFDKHKGKLPIEQRSVYALNRETGEVLYQSPGDLWNSVKQYQGKLSSKDLKKEEQEKIYRETEFIYKDEETEFQIVSPLTKESAQWWGKGTRWCTSADNNNMFEHYAEDAPLFILLFTDNKNIDRKLQVWKHENDIQFMDEADNDVTLEYIKQHWRILEPICLWLNDLKYIPDKYIYKHSKLLTNTFLCNHGALLKRKTNLKLKTLYKILVQSNGYEYIDLIPKKYLTYDFCKMAVQKNHKLLEYIPNEYKTEEIYTLAIKKDTSILFSISENKRSEYLCKIAVQKNGLHFPYIPKKHQTTEMFKLSYKSNIHLLDKIPDDFLNNTCNDDIYKEIVSHNYAALYYIKDNKKTYELCKIAVINDAESLQYVPKKYRTKELYELAVKNNGYSLSSVPNDLKTKELCEIAIKQNAMALYHVPDELKTKELCQFAVKQNGLALQYVPKEHITKELCKLAIESNGLAVEYIPEELITQELCQIAVQSDGTSLHYIPQKYINFELCKNTIQNHGISFFDYMLPYISDEKIIEKLNNSLNIRKNKIIMYKEKYNDLFLELHNIFILNQNKQMYYRNNIFHSFFAIVKNKIFS